MEKELFMETQFIAATATAVTTPKGQQIGSATKQIQLGWMVIGSCSSGTFSLANGTATSHTIMGLGTYTPAATSSILEFPPYVFSEGLYLMMAGTLTATIYYRETDEV